ncbi:MAG: exosortase/archaeosortase family protein [Phycisphaeraceae bacterium]|nr:exosortase/archaeosortase family protein [Phycisphaeraceae bacterium]
MSLRHTLLRNGWTLLHLIGAAAMLLASLWVTWDAWSDVIALTMRQEEFSHAALALPLALWLAWVRRGRLRICQPIGTWIGPAMIFAGGALSTIGYQQAIEVFWHGGSLMIVCGSVLSVLGRDALAQFAPAWAVLIFLIPVPGTIRQALAVPLQSVVTSATAWFFDLAGQPLQQNGNLLTIHGVDVAIAEACNGMRLVFALILVSYALAFSLPLRRYVRLLILLASPLSALLCNILRTIPTVWFYGNWPSRADFFHAVSGWIMLLAAFGLLMAMLKVLKWATVPITRFTLAGD